MTEENRTADTADATADGGGNAPAREEAKAGARWWREVLAGAPTHDNGDETQSLMGRLVAGRFRELTEAELDAFEEELVRHLDERIESDSVRRKERRERSNLDWPGADFWLGIGCDYGPDMEFGRAIGAAAARTEDPRAFESTVGMRLPWKTYMWIEPGEVTVSKGYGAAPVRVYPEAEASSV